jgi:DNA-binding response OmpR family regulator
MKKILVAEDDKFLANAYRVKLTKSGYEVKIAADGEEVIRNLSDFNPDLIILDLMMPKVDGFAVLREVRSNDSWNKIPILVASNLGQSEDIVKATKLGAIDYIVKTDLTMKKMVEKIRHILGETTSA